MSDAETPDTADAPEEYDTGEYELAEDQTEESETPDNSDGEEWDPDRAKAKIRKTNQENKSLRDRLKKYETAEAELAEKKKTSEEKYADLSSKLTAAESRATRLEIALEKGLTATQVKRLVGTTKEELLADAEELLADLGVKKAPLSRRPRETSASSPDPAPKTQSVDDVVSAIPRL